MSVKRTPDPAGLLPDHIVVDFERPTDQDREALREILVARSPRGRLERLARVPELADQVSALRARLGPEGQADDRLMADIAAAEAAALYLSASPTMTKEVKRLHGSRKDRKPDVTAWIKRQLSADASAKSTELWDKAPSSIKDQIGPDRFAKRVTAVRKGRK